MENENNELNQNVEETQNQEQTINVEQNENIENNVEKKQSAVTSNGIVEWAKSNKKLLAIIAVVLLIAIVAIVAVSKLSGSPEKAVKNYISALNSGKASKIAKAIDIKGSLAYAQCSGYWTSDFSKFEEKYKEIKNDDEDIKDYEENIEEIIEDMDKKKTKYSIKLVDIKNVEEVKDCNKLYNVEAKVRLKYKDSDGDTQDTTKTIKFYVYKNKVVYAPITSLF